MGDQTALFGEVGVDSSSVVRIPRDPYNEYLREKFSLPRGWRWYGASSASEDAPSGFIRFVGAVVPDNNKGRPNWKKEDKGTRRTVFLDQADWRAWTEARGARLNECPACSGGQQLVGWSRDEGHIYEPCDRCEATGEYRVPTPTADVDEIEWKNCTFSPVDTSFTAPEVGGPQ